MSGATLALTAPNCQPKLVRSGLCKRRACGLIFFPGAGWSRLCIFFRKLFSHFCPTSVLPPLPSLSHRRARSHAERRLEERQQGVHEVPKDEPRSWHLEGALDPRVSICFFSSFLKVPLFPPFYYSSPSSKPTYVRFSSIPFFLQRSPGTQCKVIEEKGSAKLEDERREGGRAITRWSR